MSSQQTISQYLIETITALNINHVFGVPGDFSFPITDAISRSETLQWIGCSNELNAAYAADGYARIQGIAAISTTYGPGELSALCGIAGSYSANLPIIFMVGMPSSETMKGNKLIHHTLGNGQFDAFLKMAEQVTEDQCILTYDNAATEIPRLCQHALTTQRPVYIGVPEDIAKMPLPEEVMINDFQTTPQCTYNLNEMMTIAITISEKINAAQKPILITGDHLRVYHAKSEALELIESKNLPFATLFADKGIFSETHSNFLGLYDGHIINQGLMEYIESSDCVINLGALLSDFNTGGFTAHWPENTVHIYADRIEMNNETYDGVSLPTLLAQLMTLVVPKANNHFPHYIGLSPSLALGESPITSASLYPQWQNFFQEGDHIIAETGTVSMGLSLAQLPANATFDNQTLWGSIGWATPAALGSCLADSNKRTILITGDGSHQLTVQAIGQFYRYGQTPIIFVLNNQGYLIERLLCEDPTLDYNDICQWNYTQLPSAFGVKDWYCARVTTNKELKEALCIANECLTGVYIEVVTSDMDAPTLAANLSATLNKSRGLPVHIAPITNA